MLAMIFILSVTVSAGAGALVLGMFLIYGTVASNDWSWKLFWTTLGLLFLMGYGIFASVSFQDTWSIALNYNLEKTLKVEPTENTYENPNLVFSVEYNGETYVNLKNGRFSSNCAIFDTEDGDTLYFRGSFLIKESPLRE